MKVILAVSGGVDSVCMVHAWANSPGFLSIPKKTTNKETKIVVAHFDHGIRSDSSADARFVESLTKNLGYDFVIGEGNLTSNASEATARKARFEFLRSLLSHQDDIIATAHHVDDRRETQVINLLRGTNRRGLSVLENTKQIIRPLISKTKSEIYDYALKHKLEWVEDSTNQSDDYLRNRLRHKLIPALESNQKFWHEVNVVDQLNHKIEPLLRVVSKTVVSKDGVIFRHGYSQLPESVRLSILQPIYTNLLHATSEKQRLSRARLKQLDEWICDSSKNHKRDLAGKIVVELTNNIVTLKAK